MKSYRGVIFGLLIAVSISVLSATTYNYFSPGGALSCSAPCTSQNVDLNSGAFLLNTLPNSKLTNSSITINGTSTALGGTRTLNLASADFANQGSTMTLLHGNAAGNPSFGSVRLNTADVTSTLPVGNGGTGLTSGTLNSILYFPTTTSTATSSKLTWNNTTNILGLTNSNAPATIQNGSIYKIILDPSNLGLELDAVDISMTIDHGDIVITGLTNPIMSQQNTNTGVNGFNAFQFVNDIGDGIGFSNQPSTATRCTFVAGLTYELTPATGCSAIDSGAQNTNQLPLVLAVNGNTVAVFQNNDDLFAVGGSTPVSTIPVEYLHAVYSGSAVITTTLGDNVNSNSVTNIIGGKNSNTQINGSQACSNAVGCPASTTLLSGTTGSIGGGALIAGACASGTVSITSINTSMAIVATPVTYPGDGFWWEAYNSSGATVTVKVCASIAGTPTASNYNVRVLQ